MRYLSTRGDAARPGFESVLIKGMAPDGSAAPYHETQLRLPPFAEEPFES